MATARFRATLRPSGRGGGGHLVEGSRRGRRGARRQGTDPRARDLQRRPLSRVDRPHGPRHDARRHQGHHGRGRGGARRSARRRGENDDAPREVEVAPELAAALRRNKRAAAAWDGLSFTHRREYVEAITGAKKQETRMRRVEKTIEELVRHSGA